VGRQMSDFPANSTAKPGFELEFDDEFDQPELDTTKWFPYYLPQWSTRKLAAARYSLARSSLHLRIEADQQPWCPEIDGATRVSSLQTGCYAGTLGSETGQHRFNSRLFVSEEQPTVANYTPRYGYLEVRLKAVAIPGYMVAMWMIGFEQSPHQAAEICICELFGTELSPNEAKVGYGLHPFADALIRDEFYKESIRMDARQFHVYAVDWRPGQVEFFLDNRSMRRVAQSPNYPMQLMLGIYEIPSQLSNDSFPAEWPKVLEVDYVRGYRSTEGGR